MRTIERDIVSALVFSSDGKLLLGKKDPHGGGVYADCWHIPGGGIDDDESQLGALRRELLEETGIDTGICTVTLADDKGTGESEKTLKENGETVLCHMRFYVYRVEVPLRADIIPLQPNDDLHSLAWVSLADLKNYKLTAPSIALFARLGYAS
jgi:8-oxo-dGTP pyrophosphatase MutT (NUDIX family)